MDMKPNSANARRTWATLRVLPADIQDSSEVVAHRRQVAQRVLDYFEQNYRIADTPKVICILDSQEGWELKQQLGVDNRALHSLLKGEIYRLLPDYVQKIVYPMNPQACDVEQPFNSVIYLHRSTQATDIGLTLSLAHELQHFIQFAQKRSLWVADLLLKELRSQEFRVWWDFPAEVEARIVSKRVALALFGESAINSHIYEQILAHVTDNDVKDWEFTQSIDPAADFDLAVSTRPLVQAHREALKSLLKKRQTEPEFKNVDLDDL